MNNLLIYVGKVAVHFFRVNIWKMPDGFATLLGGGAVLLAAVIAYRSVQIQISSEFQQNIQREDRSRKEKRRRVASIYLAEIQALFDFLQMYQITDGLERGQYLDMLAIHPGDHWLKTYQSSPENLETFEPNVAGKLILFLSRMLDVLKNMRWLSDEAQNAFVGLEFSDTSALASRKVFQTKYDNIKKQTLNQLKDLTHSAGEVRVMLNALV